MGERNIVLARFEAVKHTPRPILLAHPNAMGILIIHSDYDGCERMCEIFGTIALAAGIWIDDLHRVSPYQRQILSQELSITIRAARIYFDNLGVSFIVMAYGKTICNYANRARRKRAYRFDKRNLF